MAHLCLNRDLCSKHDSAAAPNELLIVHDCRVLIQQAVTDQMVASSLHLATRPDDELVSLKTLCKVNICTHYGLALASPPTPHAICKSQKQCLPSVAWDIAHLSSHVKHQEWRWKEHVGHTPAHWDSEVWVPTKDILKLLYMFNIWISLCPSLSIYY